MIHPNLRLAHFLDLAGVLRAMDAIRAVPGVEGVAFSADLRAVEVRYDQRRTSTGAIAAALSPPSAQMVFE